MPGILRPSAGYVGRGVTLQSALECMLYHQKSLAQVKPGRRRRAASHTFSPATRRFDCRQSHTSASSRKYQPLPTMPCSRGSVPVSIVDCAVHVTAGRPQRSREVAVDRAVEVHAPGPIAGEPLEGFREIVDVASIAGTRLVEVARLIERRQPRPRRRVGGITQLEGARDLHLPDADAGRRQHSRDVGRILEGDRLVAEVVAHAEMGVDQLALTAGGAGEWAVEETDDVGCQLEDAAGLSLEADADAPAAALGPGAQLTGHADEGAGGGVGGLGAPADSPPARQARDRRLGDLRGRNRVEDRRQPERVLGTPGIGPVRTVDGLLDTLGVEAAVGKTVERERVEAETSQLVAQLPRLDLGRRAMAQVEAEAERADAEELSHTDGDPPE